MGNNLQKLPEDETDGAKKKRNKIIDAQDKFVETLMNNLEPESSEETDSEDEGPDEEKLDVDGPGEEGLDEVDGPIVQVDLTTYDFPFENLVFEGGGNKGLAYCGAVRVLEALEGPSLPPEERKLPKKIKRFAGTSAGAMTAALLAVGYNSYDIQSFLSQDLSEIFLDHGWGYLSLLPNLIMGYGWNPGKRIFDWFGNALAARPDGHADITFAQVYEKYGKELCVVVTNLNMVTTEYFHPKTTPDTPVRVAVRMSMGIPGLFQATPFANRRHAKTGHQSIYVDGGVLCNYPIHCFDGWWLSMSSVSFMEKLRTLKDLSKMLGKKERFGTCNKATLGFVLFSDDEADLLQHDLQKRVIPAAPFPETELANQKRQAKEKRERAKRKYNRNLRAVKEFLRVTGRSSQEAVDDQINISDLQKALEMINKEDFRHLFGEGVTVDEATNALDENGDGQDRDIERTVGINTGHVGTSDFTLEEKDREYVVKQGERATENFLRKYVRKPQSTTKIPLARDDVKL